MRNDTLLAGSFLNLTGKVASSGERGLLSLAFHPLYATNGRFYVSYTDVAGNSKIVRYLVSGNPDIAQSGPDKLLLTVNQPYENHNGGDIVFGPDRYLYIGLGDGGSGNDPQTLHNSGHNRVFETGVQTFGVLADDNQIDLRVWHGNAGKGVDRSHTRV